MPDANFDHLTAHNFLGVRRIMVNNFLGGLAWGIGSVIGATIVVAILLSIFRTFNFIPGINDLEKSITPTSKTAPITPQSESQ